MSADEARLGSTPPAVTSAEADEPGKVLGPETGISGSVRNATPLEVGRSTPATVSMEELRKLRDAMRMDLARRHRVDDEIGRALGAAMARADEIIGGRRG